MRDQRHRPPSRRRTLAARLLIGAAVGLVCGVWSVYDLRLLPPGIESRHTDIAGASTHVLVDAERSYILDGESRNTDFTSLAWRAELYGNLIAGRPVRALIGRRVGVAADEIAVTPRLTAGLPDGLRDPDSEQRAQQIGSAGLRHRLDIHPDPVRPVLHIYAQAPSIEAAVRLADAAVAALREHLAARTGSGRGEQIVLEQLGPARGGLINAAVRPQIMLLTGLVAFFATLALLAGSSAVRRGWSARAPARADAAPAAPLHVVEHDAWPHTTRLLPWAVACFMVILWLFPFNTIELTASLPFDLKLDRIVLPFVVGLWLLAMAAGGRHAPRLRLTPVHVAVALLGVIVALGVVVNARALNQTLEFDLGVKKLSLLISYGVLFLVVASSIRPAEVPAFIKFTLALALLAALGTVWESRMGYNVFYDLSSKLLPPFFEVGESEAGLADTSGRSLTRGPGEHPLEIVAMLSMALPITLMGMLDAPRRRTTLLYALATCVLLAAALSTDRKSSLLAPLSVALMFAYYRRAELVKMAPVAVGLAFGVQFLAPGAITSVMSQLAPDQLGVGTVSDRASDYDAVRPDLWSHLLLGRGYGTYDHVSYRILDSEMLNRLIDTGVLGLAALVGLLITIVVTASAPIRDRHPQWGPIALIAAPAAVAYLVLGFLFDVGSFPHAPYILMCIAGLQAVTIAAKHQTPLAEAVPPPAELHLEELERAVERTEGERLAAR